MMRKAKKSNNENDNTILLHRITGYIDGTQKRELNNEEIMSLLKLLDSTVIL